MDGAIAVSLVWCCTVDVLAEEYWQANLISVRSCRP